MILPFEYSSLLGAALVVAGYAIRFWGIAHLKRAGLTNLVGTRIPREYATGGPYRFSKHPLYWGGAAAMAGVGLIAFGWPGFVLAYPAMPYFVERGMYESELRSLKEKAEAAESRPAEPGP